MDWTKLPDLIATGLLTWAFASVSRSVRSRVSRSWLYGWYCIILHFVMQMLTPALPWGDLLAIGSLLTLVLAALLFMRATAPHVIRAKVNFILGLMVVLFTGTICALVFEAPGWVIGVAETVLCLTPLAMRLLRPDSFDRVLGWVISVFHLGMGVAFLLAAHSPNRVDLSLNAMLSVLYIGCAAHFFYHYRRGSTGVVISIAGFLMWASVFVLAPLLDATLPGLHIESETWNLPKYVVAVGMILIVLEEQLARNKHLALHDELTGLPNRRLFHDRLSTALARAQRSRTQAALLMMDLDNFKSINDTYGHHIGDLLLQKIAERFNQRLRQTDTVARTGGDEFAVILEPPICRTDAVVVGRSLLELLDESFVLQGHTVSVSASMGVAMYPDDAQDQRSLCILADMQMYEDKHGRAILEGALQEGA